MVTNAHNVALITDADEPFEPLIAESMEPRRSAIWVVNSRWFDPLILLVIAVNCITMASDSPLDPTGTWKAKLIDQLEQVLIGIFTFEMSVKILAFSFADYFADPWCQLDFLVVAFAWAPILFGACKSRRVQTPYLSARASLNGLPRTCRHEPA